MRAGQIRRQLVVHGHNVTPVRAWVFLLVGLVLSTLRVAVVPTGVLGIDGTVDVVARGSRQGVLVETLLGHDPAFGVVEVGGVADGEFQVALERRKG